VLVCNISYAPPRVIAAEIAEAVTAADVTATTNVVFVTLIDDPTSIVDIFTSHLGETMLEAASAADTVSVAGSVSGAVDEAATATDALDATALVPRSGMVAGVFVNSDGTSREANASGIMVNL